jgi:hypothetical protein
LKEIHVIVSDKSILFGPRRVDPQGVVTNSALIDEILGDVSKFIKRDGRQLFVEQQMVEFNKPILSNRVYTMSTQGALQEELVLKHQISNNGHKPFVSGQTILTEKLGGILIPEIPDVKTDDLELQFRFNDFDMNWKMRRRMWAVACEQARFTMFQEILKVYSGEKSLFFTLARIETFCASYVPFTFDGGKFPTVITRTYIPKTGKSSVDLVHVIEDADGNQYGYIKSVMVHYDPFTNQPIVIPQYVKDHMKDYTLQ